MVLVKVPAPVNEVVDAKVGAVPPIVMLDAASIALEPDCVPPPDKLRLLPVRFIAPALLKACALLMLLPVRLRFCPAVVAIEPGLMMDTPLTAKLPAPESTGEMLARSITAVPVPVLATWLPATSVTPPE